MKDLDALTTEELGKLFPIQIADPNPAWPDIFEKEKTSLQNILGPTIALRIEHFGSTAIPNLAAKPTIDILIEIPKNAEVEGKAIERMKNNGYHYIPRKDCPPPYPMFVKGYTPKGFKGQCFHVHMAPKDHLGLWDRLYFRDYLNAHPNTSKEYEELKLELSIKHPFDREEYTEAKKKFVDRITKKAKKA